MRHKRRGIYRDNTTGAVVANALVTVYIANSSTLATIYAAISGGSAISGSKVYTDSTGLYEYFVNRSTYPSFTLFKELITKISYSPVTYDYISIIDYSTPLNLWEFLPYGFKTNGSVNYYAELLAALTLQKPIEVPQGVYATETELTVTGLLNFFSNWKGGSATGHGTEIRYTGTLDATKAVLKITNVQSGILQGIKFNANSLAGSAIELVSNSFPFNNNVYRDLYLTGYRAQGLYLTGSGTSQHDMSELYGCYIYAPGDVTLAGTTYGVRSDVVNATTFNLFKCTIQGHNDNKHKNNFFGNSGMAAFNFYGCGLAQTVAVSGTDGYDFYLKAGFIGWYGGFTESKSCLYMGPSAGLGHPCVLHGWHGNMDSPGSPAIFYNPSSDRPLVITSSAFGENIELGVNVTPGNVSATGVVFLSGKGWKDSSISGKTNELAFGDIGHSDCYSSLTDLTEYTAYSTGYAVTLHRFATTHNITLNDDLTGINVEAYAGDTKIYVVKQDATGNRTIEWDSSWGSHTPHKAGGVAANIPQPNPTANAITTYYFKYYGTALNLVGFDSGVSQDVKEDITVDGTVSVLAGTTLFDTTAGAIAATQPDGLYIGQIKTLVLATDGGTDVTLTVTNHETTSPEDFTFADVKDTLVLMWMGTEWITIKNRGVTI